jgi:hypothetical protein
VQTVTLKYIAAFHKSETTFDSLKAKEKNLSERGQANAFQIYNQTQELCCGSAPVWNWNDGVAGAFFE